MKKIIFLLLLIVDYQHTQAQLSWINDDVKYAPLPKGFHVYYTHDSLDGKPFIAYFVMAELRNKALQFTADTSWHRRLTLQQFYEKEQHPLLLVNASFFNFDKNQNLNVVIKEGNLLAYNLNSIPMRGKDTFQYKHPLGSAIGISKNRKADIAWLYTDSSNKNALAIQSPLMPIKDSSTLMPFKKYKAQSHFSTWNMETAVGGGPVLVQDGQVMISNDQEMKFAGKAIKDKHPRTAMGYTKDGYLVILLIQGRFPGLAEGATLEQEARILISLGCVEAINLDGGGSSCMLVNGKETIKPSDKEGQRAVPAVFIIK